MKDFTKSAGSGKPAVRQTRGPGMNRGLKKKPRPKKPEPFSDPTARNKVAKKGGKGGKSPSFLSKGFF